MDCGNRGWLSHPEKRTTPVTCIGRSHPMTYLIRKPYWEWVKDEARKIKSDGCTGVRDWNRECCWQHDLVCRYGKDPRSAYEYYFVDPRSNYWTCAKRMSRQQGDYQFAECNLEWNTPGKVGKVRGMLRFLGVRIGAVLGLGKREPTWSYPKETD